MKFFRKSLLTLSLLAAALPAFADMQKVTAISTPTGAGQKVIYAILEYSQEIDASKLRPATFKVEGRNVEQAFVTNQPNVNGKVTNGRYVVLVLNPHDPDASLLEKSTERGALPTVKTDFKLEVSQVRPLQTLTEKPAKVTNLTSSTLINQVVDDFQQFTYTDATTGTKIKYNLYVPANYDPHKSYPLVMFIHDAGNTSPNVETTLLQGNGATVWASPEVQAQQEAFVLAPQFDHEIVNDKSEDPADLEPTLNLIKTLANRYNIDMGRIYATGQSGGGMMEIAMNIKYPNFFAGTYLVACQWDSKLVAPMAKNNMFVFVSQDDAKAYPTQNQMRKVLEENGAVYGYQTVNGLAKTAELDQAVKELLAQGGNIHYMTIESGTLPAQKLSQSPSPGAAHMGTWEIAYNIPAIHSWLFAQRQPTAYNLTLDDVNQVYIAYFTQKPERFVTTENTSLTQISHIVASASPKKPNQRLPKSN
ncbi:pyrroline-5-carboxylate reductase [Psittacicella hinzii]|uniref:Esterase Ig-like N-terminal domain-containing protein n=1 Tax=Psittacicella hinzii TaxID=2028575 RepID=A0A3A1YNW3_9GAMM|nr:pyrroline-5-carboxylate reductase [Psittacicella hinzii]RIY39852.1 hypothetical protein CKF58_01415 [Psittacicella hinzii]